MTKVHVGSFLAIVLAGTLAAVIVAAIPRRFAPPVVMLELVLGIIIGPQVLGLANTDTFVTFFSNLGLGMLFFFAGYEIDFDRVRGKALVLAAWGWLLSMALAYGIGGLLAGAGIVLSFLYTGSALATTAADSMAAARQIPSAVSRLRRRRSRSPCRASASAPRRVLTRPGPRSPDAAARRSGGVLDRRFLPPPARV